MKILFEENEIDRIAADDADGKFYLRSDGVILYIGPGEFEPWYVNATLDRFQKSVQVYNSYGAEVVVKETEEEQLTIVAKFREAILAIENFDNQNKSYWACIVQQAEEGQI
jgi:hypothetical protein